MNPTRSGEILQTRKLHNQKIERHTPFLTIASALREHMQRVKVIQLSKRNRNQILSPSPNSLWAHAEISAREMLLLFSRSSAKSYRSTHFSFSDHMGGTDDCPSALHRRDSWHPAYLRSSVRWEHSQAHCSVELVECSVAWRVHHDVHAGGLHYY